MNESNKKCVVSGLTVTLKNFTFVPVAPDSDVVVKFELRKSIVPVLTKNICITFTKLKQFVAIEQHIEIVEDYAFNNCTDVVDINLEQNNIHKLGVGIFSNTKKLQRVHILGGSLSYMDIDLLSNLTELNQLLYSANGLKELPIAAMKNLKKLELLYLYSNDLTDLDAEGLVANLPSLKSIYINDNNFHCDRLIEIIEIFRAKNIRVPDHTYEKHVKKRDYIPRKISNIICLTQAQVDAEKLKKALNGSLDDLKDFPLGKAVIQLKDVVNSGFIDTDSEIVNLTNAIDEQISYLNGTLQNNSIETSGSIDELSKTIQTAQHTIEDESEVIRKHEEAISVLSEKYTILMSEEKSKANKNGEYESLSNSTIAVWACLVMLLLINVAIGLWVLRVTRKFGQIDMDGPFLCYEERVERNDRQLLHETYA